MDSDGVGHPRVLGIFEKTIFSRYRELRVTHEANGIHNIQDIQNIQAGGLEVAIARPAFIRAMHPKTEMSPRAIEKVLNSGWVGQMKIHGHRAQIHLHAQTQVPTSVFNRQGKLHKKILEPEIIKELRRIFAPKEGFTVIDAEWLKAEKIIFLFDLLKQDGRSLRSLTYQERWDLLPKTFISKHVKTLPLLRNFSKCMEVLERKEDFIEGLVFKSLDSKGFDDTSIVRCRKK